MRTCVLPLFLWSLGVLPAEERKSSAVNPTSCLCEQGSAKSVIAAEFERMAKKEGLDLNILACGTDPMPKSRRLFERAWRPAATMRP